MEDDEANPPQQQEQEEEEGNDNRRGDEEEECSDHMDYEEEDNDSTGSEDEEEDDDDTGDEEEDDEDSADEDENGEESSDGDYDGEESESDVESFPESEETEHFYKDEACKFAPRPTTLVELRIEKVNGQIRQKPEWFHKIQDPAIRERWLQEAIESGIKKKIAKYAIEESLYIARRLERLAEWAIAGKVQQALDNPDKAQEDGDELFHYPLLFAPAGVDNVIASCGPLLSTCPTLRQDFLEAIKNLEEHPEGGKKDWHPHSNEQVLDLVHPSLYCYVRGVSPVLVPADKQRTLAWKDFVVAPRKVLMEQQQQKEDSHDRFQWLPADVLVDADGKVKIDSYINNLHPKEHEKLYACLQSIFQLALPGFERCLSAILNPVARAIHINQVECMDTRFDGEDDEDDWETRLRKTFIQPTLTKFTPGEGFMSCCFPHRVDLRGRKLQVIVKLANIHLTPEKPVYEGGVWHLEGTDAERIVATGIYYYSIENLTESRLSFRTGLREECLSDAQRQQDDYVTPRLLYGVKNHGVLSQYRGCIKAQEGSFVVFPNLIQHKVEPFELADKSKPGHRKILAFFLVDPKKEILSTASVPPQQSRWVLNELLCRMSAKGTAGTGSGESGETVAVQEQQVIPPELQPMISGYLDDYCMSREKAEEYREALMEARAAVVEEVNDEYFERVCSLCEH